MISIKKTFILIFLLPCSTWAATDLATLYNGTGEDLDAAIIQTNPNHTIYTEVMYGPLMMIKDGANHTRVHRLEPGTFALIKRPVRKWGKDTDLVLRAANATESLKDALERGNLTGVSRVNIGQISNAKLFIDRYVSSQKTTQLRTDLMNKRKGPTLFVFYKTLQDLPRPEEGWKETSNKFWAALPGQVSESARKHNEKGLERHKQLYPEQYEQ